MMETPAAGRGRKESRKEIPLPPITVREVRAK